MEPILLPDEKIDTVNENLRLIQKKHGLTYGSDAYLLAAYIRQVPHAKAADLGSGTGILSLLCTARDKFRFIYSVEVQSSFCSLIQRNVDLNGFGNRILPLCADVRQISAKDTDGELDVVFCNPPYMRSDSGRRNSSDEKFIARHEVFGGIDDFCAAADRLLKFGGTFYCVYRPDRLAALMQALHENHLEPKEMTFVCADVQTPPSMLLLKAKKGGNPSLKLTRPLILHALPGESRDTEAAGSRPLTKEAEEIYRTCSFQAFRHPNA